MDFSNPPRPRNDSNIVPMINVVFLLLIFFLMSASFTAPLPFDLKLPVTDRPASASDPREPALHVAADGEIAYGTLSGSAALAALAEGTGGRPVRLFADARLSGRALVRILSRLNAAGVMRVNLVLARK